MEMFPLMAYRQWATATTSTPTILSTRCVPPLAHTLVLATDYVVTQGHFRIRLMNRKFEYIHPDLTMDLEMPLEQAKAENNTFCTRLTAGEYGKLPELFVLTTLTQATDHDEFREVDYIEAWVSAQSRTLTDRIIDDLNEKGVIDDDEVSAEFKRLIDDKGLPEVLKKGKDLILADMFEVNDVCNLCVHFKHMNRN